MGENQLEQLQFIEMLYLKYKPALLRLARSYVSDPFAAEDIIQTSFEEVIKHAALLMALPCHKLKSYLVNIVRSRAINYIGKEKALANIDDWRDTIASDHPDDDVASKVVKIMQYEECKALLQGVNERYRVVLQLKYLSGKSDREIAGQIGIGENSVRKYLQRAIAQFRKLAKDKEVAL